MAFCLLDGPDGGRWVLDHTAQRRITGQALPARNVPSFSLTKEHGRCEACNSSSMPKAHSADLTVERCAVSRDAPGDLHLIDD
jgi:streptogramin lyase